MIQKALINSGRYEGCTVEVINHEYRSGRHETFSKIKIIQRAPKASGYSVGYITDVYSWRLDLFDKGGAMNPNAAFARSKSLKREDFVYGR